MPKSYAERQLILARVLADADPRPAPPMTATQYLNYSGRKNRASQVAAEHYHAAAVMTLQRAANPSIDDRLATVGLLTAGHRSPGYVGYFDDRDSREGEAKKSFDPTPSWAKGF